MSILVMAFAIFITGTIFSKKHFYIAQINFYFVLVILVFQLKLVLGSKQDSSFKLKIKNLIFIFYFISDLTQKGF